MQANRKPSHTAIIGAACRLPGASSVAEFWSLLVEGRNSVRRQPDNRWSVERFLRPGNPEPGFAYTFAGGYLDDPLGFDPAPFGVSPREAQQMDPQQRLLLEVVWEALEDAGIPPSTVAGTQVGVYVGASMVDYQGTASLDPAVMESHFMTGNSLAVLSNRISYIYDFKGPSFTLDSACSSSFVALKQAADALEEGKIDLAVVAGVNMLLSPVPFIGFSQARMLSPTGLSRPFSAKADGYVRSEGAVVVVLRRESDAAARGERVRGLVVGAAVNSDGRTTGISLPSIEGQRDLIDRLYADVGISPENLAFVEAHGTGTKVGDPIEANAIGQSLGQKRKDVLPIGSVKSNIGHLEAASGLAGLLKSVLALEHRVLPPSLFLDQTNEMIDFEGLNLVPNAAARPLELPAGKDYAGICNYGFGGTNAHVIVKAAPQVAAATQPGKPTHLMVTAADRDSLVQQAGRLADMIEAGADAHVVAATLAHGREAMKSRLVVPLAGGNDAGKALRNFSDGLAESAGHVSGAATSGDAPVVFAFSGNGSQFAEMGHAAYAGNARFRAEIGEIDTIFKPLAGWSLVDKLTHPIAPADLEQTSIAQPLIYAVQSALVACLAEAGIRPAGVLGHSVGEVAAAEAAGILTRAEATRLIYLRSKHQEKVRGLGRMMVVAAEAPQVDRLLQAFGDHDIEIAAYNSGTSTTVSGPADQLKSFAKHCRAARVATVALDIDYPFHSSALDGIGEAMIADLASLSPKPGHTPFYSTVAGERRDGTALTAEYWWQNIRRPVRFLQALKAAAVAEGQLYLEIGPRAILTGPIAENLRDAGIAGETLASLSQKDRLDPVALVIARLVAHGAKADSAVLFGARPARMAELPGYAFQRQSYQLPGTAEHFNAFGKLNHSDARHPLLGARMADGSPEWRALLDPAIVPYLDDHRVDGGVIVPAAGLIEMALAAGRDLFGERPLQLPEFDVLRALAIAQDETREISTRYAEATNTIEVWSRKRFSAQEWVLHARGRVEPLTTPVNEPLPPPIRGAGFFQDTAAEVYAEATAAGLDYGPMFQLVTSSERDHVTTDSMLALPDEAGLGAFVDRHVISPISLDATFHGLFISRPQKEGERKAHLPVRFRGIKVWKHGAKIRRCITLLTNETDRYKTVAITMFDETGAVVGYVDAAVLRALYLGQATTADRTFRIEALPITLPPAALARLSGPKVASNDNTDDAEVPPAWLIVRAFSVSLAHRIVSGLAPDGRLDPAALVASGQVAEESLPILEAARIILDGFGLVQDGVLAAENPLPPADEVLSTLLTSFPEANLEIRLAAQALAHADRLIRKGGKLAVQPSARDQIESAGLLVQPALAALREALLTLAGTAGRKIRVLAIEPWSTGLLNAVTPLVRAGRIEVTLAAPNRKAIDNARLIGKVDPEIEFLDLEEPLHIASPLGFDALVAVANSAIGGEAGVPEALRGLLRPGAAVVVAQPGADATLDFLLGLWAGWFAAAGKGEAGLPRTPSLERTREAMSRFGAEDLTATATSDGLGALICGTVPAVAKTALETAYAVVVSGLTPFDKALARGADLMLAADETLGDRLTQLVQDNRLPPHLVYPVSLETADPAERVASHIEALKRIAEALDPLDVKTRVTVCTLGAHDDDAEPAAIAASLWGFLRVAINEFPNVDFRLADFDSALPDPGAQVEALLGLSGGELEVLVRADGLKCLRMRRNLFPPAPLADSERSVLRFEQAGRLDSFSWIRETRTAPGDGEIEIEVAAVGLNYRDILVGLGILDDDLLGAGLTAAALGFECSGIVTRVGPGVTALKPGDAVMGFAANTFASHLVSPAWHFFPVPEGVSLEAAATIPVAFATAWFALVKRAQIGKGDDVLIHGGAGGVGLAAIQFAKQAGSRVLATASSEERRSIARAMGADLTYDSRQERFAEAIRSEIGGVDVVLNSLAGAAMLASFRLVKPFGRFVELGKRDYLDNTQMGLRPFVRNIAYFGVDIDELLAHDRPLVEAMMKQISQQFAEGTLKPLPYRVFEGEDVGTAFRLMQASEHVGKIVVRPSKLAARAINRLAFKAKPGAYLVVGGTSGLGFATARWLAGKGASTLVLASRRGRVEEGLEAEVEALRKRGITVAVEALDVASMASVEALVAKVTAEHGPIRGVIHAAVLLDDGMINGLTPDRLRAVLRPKIDGARNLDAALDGQPLDFFVLYSSATTVIGSPGQGAYVAANAWLEGFARERRERGKPALAIGWGAISDVGIIARDKQLGRRLRRTTGVVGISSTESLAHLGRLLVLGNEVGPMQFYTNISPGAAAEKLRLINSPAFAGLGLARREDDGEQEGDLVTAIEGKSKPEAITIIVGALKREISHILRMPEEQIDVSRPLGELGLDSLMALELQLSIERLCGTDVPLVGAGDRRLGDIAALIHTSLGGTADDSAPDPNANMALAMSGLHGGDISTEEAEALSQTLKVAGSRRGS